MARSLPSPVQALRTLHQPYTVPLHQVPSYQVERSQTPGGTQRSKETYYTPQGVYVSRPTNPLGILIVGVLGFWLVSHPQQTAALRVALAPPTQPLARTAAGQGAQQGG